RLRGDPMMRGVSRAALGLAVAVLAGVAGCGGGGDAPTSASTSSMAEAKVSGTVKVGGKKATDGEVVFDPSNVNRKVGSRRAKIGADGRYEATTLVGANTVTIAGKAAKDSPKAAYYSQPFDVQSGSNTLDIDAP